MRFRTSAKIQGLIMMMLCFSFALAPLARGQAVGGFDHGRIHPGDLLEVDFVGSIEGDWRGYIGPEGFLSGYALVDEPILALCMRVDELAAVLAARLGRDFREPRVRVSIVDTSRRPVAVLAGAVRKPHRFQIRRTVTLRELVVLAGGFSETVSGSVQIYRPGGLGCPAVEGESGRATVARGEFREIAIADILAGMPDTDPEIGSGDVVTVFQAAPVYIVGGVSRPMQVSTRNELTLSRAVAMAGGLSRTGDGRRVRIFRASAGDGGMVEVDLGKVTAGVIKDPPLRPFDIVEIPEKGRPKASEKPYARLEELVRADQSQLPLLIVD